MNEDFNGTTDLNNVIDEFQSIIGNTNLTYKLAKIDPNGNCIEGITRTFWRKPSCNGCKTNNILGRCFI